MIKLAAAASPPSAQKTSFKSFLKKANKMFHITQLTHGDSKSPPTWPVRPLAVARAKGYPDMDLAAVNQEQALHLYTLKHAPKRKVPSPN